MFLDSQKNAIAAKLFRGYLVSIGDQVSRLHIGMRLFRRAFPSICSIFFFSCWVTPMLHCQEINEQPNAIADSSVAEIVQEVPTLNENVAADAQNPEPSTQDNSNPAATYQPVT